MVGPTGRYRDVWYRLNTHCKVHYIVGRSLRCSFYKPEYDAVLKRYVELKKANRPVTLSTYMEERKKFVRQSFEVRAAESPVLVTGLLTFFYLKKNSLVVLWVLGGPSIRRKSVPRSRKFGKTRMKTNGNGKICTSCVPIHVFHTHGCISVHTKLTEAGYSSFDFPIWDPEWDKAVTKQVKLTDRCTVIHSFLRA